MKNENLDAIVEACKQMGLALKSGNNARVMIHEFDIANLDETKWDISSTWNSGRKTSFLSAKPKEPIENLDLTVFD